MFLNFVKRTSKIVYNSKDSKTVLIFYQALAVVEFLAILWFFSESKLQNISGNHAATWQQKLVADFPSLGVHQIHVNYAGERDN